MNAKTFRLSWRVYLPLGIAFLISVVGLFCVREFLEMRVIFSASAVGSLAGAIFQLIRDNAQFEREHFLHKDRHLFELAINSSMADIAFLKNADFCQDYIDAFDKAIGRLITHGPTPEALEEALKLQQVRAKYQLWVPSSIHIDLSKFEYSLRVIGANQHTVKDHHGTEAASEALQNALKAVEAIFDESPSDGADEDQDRKSISRIKAQQALRDFLGADSFWQIREYVTSAALRFADLDQEKHN